MARPEIYQIINDDYANLDVGNASFYYGYEYGHPKDGDDDDTWGFFAQHDRVRIFGIPYDEMQKIKNCPRQFDCAECLLFGIGIYLATADAVAPLQRK